jgi:uncharacterized membrane protein
VTDALLFFGLIGLAFLVWLLRADVKYLHRRVRELEERQSLEEAMAREPIAVPPPPPVRAAAKARRAAVVTASVPPTASPPPDLEPKPAPQARRTSPFADLSFEGLIGGKLPIWVGGISLVFAGFFLVRFTIEAGLFGPGARAITAALFAFAMIALSEFGGRLPKIGPSFAADPRLGQSLAGAGIATLYGTLYMAAEIYGLVGIGAAFVLVVLTTALAFALALRHGPPTALMGLIGGFAAPWAAGMGASNLPTLLLYLAVFIAALFGLAVWRRWLWLLVLASGGGLAWSLAMLATANSNLGLLAGFIALTGGAALLAAQRFEGANGLWLQLARYAPMAVALAQLAILLPKTGFSATGWIFYFALSILAIALAWRERALLPMVAAALVIALGPLGLAWAENGASSINIAVALAITALFGAAGHIRARTSEASASYWAIIALAAPALVWFTTSLAHHADADRIWGALAVAAALPAVWTAWEWHATRRPAIVQPWASGTAALLIWAAFLLWIDSGWAASYSAIVALGVAAWARVTGGLWERRIARIPLFAAMAIGFALSYRFTEAIGASLSGVGAFYNLLPPIGEAWRTTLVPALLIGAIAWTPAFASGRRTRALALFAGGSGIAAFIWLIAKQPAQIVSPSDFIRIGFAERAVFTQLLFLAGWLALQRGGSTLRTVGLALSAVAFFRTVWFDLLVHNPVLDPQAVGPVPVANLLTGHLALVALWLWLFAAHVPTRFRGTTRGASLAFMVLTVLAAIRQAVQGNLVSGAIIDTGENYLYSAGLLALAIIWLAVGIRRASKLLRVAGLLLLTIVTFKVFLIDAAALTGLLRIVSFLGLGFALIGIGWAYGRLMRQSGGGNSKAQEQAQP